MVTDVSGSKTSRTGLLPKVNENNWLLKVFITLTRVSVLSANVIFSGRIMRKKEGYGWTCFAWNRMAFESTPVSLIS